MLDAKLVHCDDTALFPPTQVPLIAKQPVPVSRLMPFVNVDVAFPVTAKNVEVA